ncbi:MAG: PDDEXK nuclease domain-containing protein [bacterium]|jgi:predicted nuclease of restriction endonuclease-like (RecB) superfamily|nr:PDDEXK nuclease domain-containing protein [bacterium]
MKKLEITTKDDLLENVKDHEGYRNLLNELKSILSKGQARAYKAVDNIKVQTYWQIGERIVRDEIENKERAEYGKQIVAQISFDLGINKRELYRIIRFFKLYEIVATVSPQLSWNHYKELVDIENDKERVFYQNNAINNNWSVRELRIKIKSDLFNNSISNDEKLPARKRQSISNALEIFKAEYDLGFAGTHQNEEELESGIVHNIDSFLRELGHEISYCGRQVPIKIDGLNHYIDILLYHKGIPCNILVELKTRKFDARDIGQMNKYVNYFRTNRQYEHEKETIGLIICSEAGIEEAQYALGGLEEKIFIATYQPKLPTMEQLKKALKKVTE